METDKSDEIPSLERQIKRWNNLPFIPPKTTCAICKEENDLDKMECHKQNDSCGASEIQRFQCPKCGVIVGDKRYIDMPIDEKIKDYDDFDSYYTVSNCGANFLNILEKFGELRNKTTLIFARERYQEEMGNKIKNTKCDILKYLEYVKNPPNKKYEVIYCEGVINTLSDPISELKTLLNNLEDDGHIIFSDSIVGYNFISNHYFTYFYSELALEILYKELSIKLHKYEKNDGIHNEIFKKISSGKNTSLFGWIMGYR